LLKTGSNQLDIRVGSRWYKSGIGRGLLGPVTLKIGSRPIATAEGPFRFQNARKPFSFKIRPAMSNIKIIFSQEDNYRMAIQDIQGRTLKECVVNKASMVDIPKAYFPPAIYIISVWRGGDVRQTKYVMVR
jgi:hypothetical protein